MQLTIAILFSLLSAAAFLQAWYLIRYHRNALWLTRTMARVVRIVEEQANELDAVHTLLRDECDADCPDCLDSVEPADDDELVH